MREKSQHLASEYAAEHSHGQEEAGLRCDPASVIEGQSSGGGGVSVKATPFSQLIESNCLGERGNRFGNIPTNDVFRRVIGRHGAILQQ